VRPVNPMNLIRVMPAEGLSVPVRAQLLTSPHLRSRLGEGPRATGIAVSGVRSAALCGIVDGIGGRSVERLATPVWPRGGVGPLLIVTRGHVP
jgi:hypothetical protein